MLKPRKIIRDYTPDYKALNTLDKQTKVIQDLYDQVSEFYRFISEPAFRAEIKGEQGPQGEQGERGHDGAKGDKGATGNPGPQGVKGPRGDDGLPGPQGPEGPQGPAGIPGPEGPRGPRGYIGLQGPQGPEGPEGKRGDSGSPFGLEGVFNTYAELVAESTRKNAKFYLVASNNKENGDLYVYRAKYDDFIFLNNLIYDLAFQIVQGPRGPIGPQGEQGIQGITGKSSYELAVEQGYQGSLEEYLQLIKEIYVGTGSVYTDVFVAANKHENLESPSRFNITVTNNKIIVIYPSTNTYVGVPKMNGIDIPMVSSTFTYDNIQYNVFTSINNYNGNLIITI